MRTLKFTKDQAVKDVTVKSSGKTCQIRVPPGLANDSRPVVTYYQTYQFEREPWWPKFEKLKAKYNISVVKGDRSKLSRKANNFKPIKQQSEPQQNVGSAQQTQNFNNNNHT
jgi:hypothetical protein